MRIVLDTNILIRANPKSRGPARELLQEMLAGDHVLVTSPFLLQELERVLAYPRIAQRWNFRRHEIEQYLHVLASVSEVVAPTLSAAVVLRDVNDDPILYTAVAGKADALCTLDAHFYDESVISFCLQRNIAVMDDIALLRTIRGTKT